MIATGIVRRIDDLGRIVIPKEIRRNMRIKEGDPLELFYTRDGEVIFKKYTAYNEKDWEKAFRVVCALIPNISFALYDYWGELKQTSNAIITPDDYSEEYSEIIDKNNETIGYIYTYEKLTEEDEKIVKKVLTEILSDEEE